MTEKPLISFVTISYNGLEDTRQLVQSLQSTIHSVSYEIIIVDNASTSNEAETLRKEFPDTIVLRSEQNLGFSGGNNLGIQVAGGKYIFLINNDTYLTGDGLHHLVGRIESRPDIAAVSPKIRFAFPPQAIQFAGYTPLSRITLRNALIGFGEADDGRFDIAAPTPYLHGAAMMVKREAIEKAGLMPEIYFLYYEELDWSTCLTNAGYQLWYEPRCTIFHKESQSTGQQSKLRTFYLTRNRLLYAWRNRQGTGKWLSISYQISIAATKSILTSALKGRFDLCGATLRGIWAFIVLPDKLGK